MDSGHWLTSAGIDIGTSTVKCAFSRLRIEQRSGLSSLPQLHITERTVFYHSPMHATPLTGDSQINLPLLEQILAEEYLSAGLHPDDIDTGAVIITGETAFRQDADAVLHILAGRAGAFVIAQAGGDLEAVLAGKGSGAEVRSRELQGQVINVDIGGGTANAAFFENGTCVRTLNFHIGGRLLTLEADGTLTGISPSVQQWLTDEGYGSLRHGGAADLENLREICCKWSQILLEGILGNADLSACPLLYGNPPGGELREKADVAELWISGGVGALMGQDAPLTLADAVRFGDVGPLLAHALRITGAHYPVRMLAAPGAQRATVIGAGVHTAMLSGSTVFADIKLLPLKNIPIVRADWKKQKGAGMEEIGLAVKEAFAEGKQRYAASGTPAAGFAVIIPHLSVCSYPLVRLIAEAAAASALQHQLERIVLICENDIAKALGNCLYLITGGKLPCVCLDQITAEHGDYVDIGRPVAGGAVPLAIKTLVFQSGVTI